MIPLLDNSFGHDFRIGKGIGRDLRDRCNMNILQQYQFWVGLGLVIPIMAFFIYAFFKAPNMTQQQYIIIKFMAALCAGFAGALIAGETLFRAEGSVGGEQNKYLFSGTAGFALFGLVWFIFPKYPTAPPPPPNSFRASLPEGFTFQQGAEYFAEIDDHAFAAFEGFSKAELGAKLQSRQINTPTARDAIRLLRSATVVRDAIREYNVRYADSDSTYYLRVQD
jgi:hypothetical protein